VTINASNAAMNRRCHFFLVYKKGDSFPFSHCRHRRITMACQAVTVFLRQQRTADKKENSEKGKNYFRSCGAEVCAQVPGDSIPHTRTSSLLAGLPWDEISHALGRNRRQCASTHLSAMTESAGAISQERTATRSSHYLTVALVVSLFP
jgi:hypothetical protein